MKQIKTMLVIGLIALSLVFGIVIGERRVIKQQRIEKVQKGYTVEFDGELYDYSN